MSFVSHGRNRRRDGWWSSSVSTRTNKPHSLNGLACAPLTHTGRMLQPTCTLVANVEQRFVMVIIFGNTCMSQYVWQLSRRTSIICIISIINGQNNKTICSFNAVNMNLKFHKIICSCACSSMEFLNLLYSA